MNNDDRRDGTYKLSRCIFMVAFQYISLYILLINLPKIKLVIEIFFHTTFEDLAGEDRAHFKFSTTMKSKRHCKVIAFD